MTYRSVQRVWNLIIALKRRSWLSKYRVRVEGVEKIPGGKFVLCANHAHAQDPYVLGVVIRRAVRYMANIEGVSPLAAAVAGLVGAFGKRKGMPDFTSLKTAIRYLKDGDPVGVFPEGDRSWDGKTAPMPHSVIRMAKIAAAPILIARQQGSYLSQPRWADNPRRGSWRIEFSLIPESEVRDKSVEELHERLTHNLANDDPAWAEAEQVEFEGRGLARGITRVLWACRACSQARTLVENDDEVRCASCGAAWTVDCWTNLCPQPGTAAGEGRERLSDWMPWQRNLAASLQSLSIPTLRLEKISASGQRSLWGPGEFRFVGETFEYLPEKDSKAGDAPVFHAAGIEGFVDNFNAHSAFSYGKARWKITFRAGSAVLVSDLLARFSATQEQGFGQD